MKTDFKKACYGKECKNEGAFTLIEVLVAMAILSIGILGLMKLQLLGIHSNFISNSATVSGSLAQLHMENIFNTDFHDPGLRDVNKYNNKALNSIDDFDYRNVHVDGTPVEWGEYDLIWNIADNTPIKNAKTISVIVTWDKGKFFRRISSIKSLASCSRISRTQ